MVDSNSDPDEWNEQDRPEWWRRAAEEFEHHDLRPYRPPRFADGTLKHEVVGRLERDCGVEITFVCFDPEPNDSWEVRVDGTPVVSVGHRRHRAGYSIFEVDAEAFESRIREWLDSNQ